MISGVAVAAGTSGAIVAGQTGHPLAGYFDAANAVESSLNSGLWKVGYVYLGDSRGAHPNSGGAALMASTINTTLFTPNITGPGYIV
jgi:hypothetical protein